jgi:hypothetical protein
MQSTPNPKGVLMSTKTTALAIAASLAAAALVPATSSATATDTGRHAVNADATLVTVKPGVGFSGTMAEGQTFDVKRLSPSGKYAYGRAYGHVNRNVWVQAAKLDPKRTGKATRAGRHSVTKKSTYVYERAGVGFSGTMFEGNTFDVKRLSPSGRWAYGKAFGHVNRHVWIDARDLTPKG